MKKVIEGAPGGVMVGRENVVDLDFMDDDALMADTWMVLVRMMMRMKVVTQRFVINISTATKKSEVMYVGRRQGDVRVEDVNSRAHKKRDIMIHLFCFRSTFRTSTKFRIK